MDFSIYPARLERFNADFQSYARMARALYTSPLQSDPELAKLSQELFGFLPTDNIAPNDALVIGGSLYDDQARQCMLSRAEAFIEMVEAHGHNVAVWRYGVDHYGGTLGVGEGYNEAVIDLAQMLQATLSVFRIIQQFGMDTTSLETKIEKVIDKAQELAANVPTYSEIEFENFRLETCEKGIEARCTTIASFIEDIRLQFAFTALCAPHYKTIFPEANGSVESFVAERLQLVISLSDKGLTIKEESAGILASVTETYSPERPFGPRPPGN